MKTISIKKRFSNEVLFTTDVEDNDPRPTRTALMAAVRAGRDPEVLRTELDAVRAQDEGDLTTIEREVRTALICVIERELANPQPRANLADAYLARANLAGANLAGAKNAPQGAQATEGAPAVSERERLADRARRYRERRPDIPVVENLDRKILEAITDGSGVLEMGSWHGDEPNGTACGTTHCRAGFAIHFAGPAGYALEEKYGAEHAGAMIYRASTGQVPYFYGSNEEALEDIKRCAALQAEK